MSTCRVLLAHLFILCIYWYIHTRYMARLHFSPWHVYIPYLQSKEQLSVLRETRADATWQHLTLRFLGICLCIHACASKADEPDSNLSRDERRAVIQSVASMSLTLRDVVRSSRGR